MNKMPCDIRSFKQDSKGCGLCKMMQSEDDYSDYYYCKKWNRLYETLQDYRDLLEDCPYKEKCTSIEEYTKHEIKICTIVDEKCKPNPICIELYFEKKKYFAEEHAEMERLSCENVLDELNDLKERFSDMDKEITL